MSIKKIGREVLFMHVNDEFSRNGEGAFIRLKNGDILYAYTKYPAGDWADRAEADIYGIYSSDEGETWHGDRKLLERRNGEINYMSVSFLRMEREIFMLLSWHNFGICLCHQKVFFRMTVN